MEKLTHFIPSFRISEETKKAIQLMADQEKRKLTDFIRTTLDRVVDEKKLCKK